MKKVILLTQSTLLFFSMAMSQEFTISGTQLIDANGKNFVMRGLAVPLSWFVSEVSSNVVNIRNNSNANCLRIVMNTSNSNNTWQNFVTSCIANNMIPMVELHDQTCGTTSEGLADMANWWVSKKSFLTDPDIQKYILINIANEWGDWNMATNSPESWRDAYINAVSIMRTGGITSTLVIDAPNCGQDLQNGRTLKSYAMEVFDSDSLKNCLFSVHLYGEWESGGGSKPANLPTIKDAGIPFYVGEFAASVDDTAVMNTCQRNGIGWLAWSWKGNNDPTYTDMSYDWPGTNLTLWGNAAINGPNGMKHTGHIASVFAGDSGCVPTTIEPYLQVNGGDWVASAQVIVNVGDSVVIGPQPSADGSWKWMGPHGFTATSREITLDSIQTNQGGYYIATYTNADTCISDTAIKISVVACAAADTSILSGATYKIVSKYSGKSPDVVNSSSDDGALIQQMAPVDSANQEWIIADIGDGYWEISSVNSGKALTVVDASLTIGALIEQREYTDINNQKWLFINDNNGYYQIKNVRSKKCLDIKSASTADGASIVQYTCGAEDNQKFSLTKLKDPSSILSPTSTENILIFPNPANGGSFSVSLASLAGRSHLRIYSMQGRLAYSALLTEKVNQINSGLTNGMYIVNIVIGSNSFNQKLIID